MSDGLMRYWPVAVLVGGMLVTAGGLQFQIRAMAGEIDDQSESIDENEEMIEMLRRQLLERQGSVDLRTQRIEIEQQQQTEDLDQIQTLLQQLLLELRGR